jgi:CRP-like cAMP-binding protein
VSQLSEEMLLDNSILAALPRAALKQIIPALEKVELPLEKEIYKPGEPIKYLYFPINSFISALMTMDHGASVEVGSTGNEGMVACSILLQSPKAAHLTIVQLAGMAFRLEARALLATIDKCQLSKALLQRYINARIIQLAQSIACNRFHQIKARLCRWLLTTQDAVRTDQFQIKQEFLSAMLGTRQASISEALNALKRAELIENGRNTITILNRPALTVASCECYITIRKSFESIHQP